MSGIYRGSHRQLRGCPTTPAASLTASKESLLHDTIQPSDKDFIERMDMFFLATVDERGHVNCSYKGGEPGFVRIVDEHTLAFPNYDGNGMYL